MAWNLASRPSLHEPSALVALDDVQFALRGFLLSQSTNLATRLVTSVPPDSFLRILMRSFLRAFARALVDEHLFGDLVRLGLVLDEINLQVAAQQLGHGLLDELVRDGLLVWFP